MSSRRLRCVLVRLAVAAIALSTAMPVAAQASPPAHVQGADFVASTRALSAMGDAESWVGYRVPLVEGSGSVCCYQGHDGQWTRGCRLDRGDSSWHGRRTLDARPEVGESLTVLIAPAGARRPQRVRFFDSACPVRAQGMRIEWLGEVGVDDSIAALAGWIEDDRRGHGALAAIAHHAGGQATRFLTEAVRAATRPDGVRTDAAFWLGAARGDEGFRALDRLLDEIDRPSLRAELVVGLAQSEVPAALDRLIDLARHDRSPKVRGQGLFWLAQTARAGVSQVLVEAAERDPETAVKKKAVFALSQLPSARGVPLLIDVASNHESAAVREQAIFWLGQSEDPAALEFIVSLLED